MNNCLAIVFDFNAGKTTFHLLEGEPDTLRLQVDSGLSTEEFFKQRKVPAERARETFPGRFAAAGNGEPLTWVIPVSLEDLYRQRPDLQKLANMIGLPVFVFRRRSAESPHLEFQLASRTLR